MPYDYTDAPPSRDIELIPYGTIATVVLHIRAGNVGEDGLLRRSAKGIARCSTANSSSSMDRIPNTNSGRISS